MSTLRIAVVPVARMDAAEVEAAAARVAKTLHQPVDIKEPATLPKNTEDAARRQHDAVKLLAALRADLARLKTAKVVGADPAAPAPSAAADVTLFVTDVDLFTQHTDATVAEADPRHRVGIVSVRRLREAFFKRKADPPRQRARLVKEMLRVAARLKGLPDCPNPDCALAPGTHVAEIDRRQEHYCAPCWKRLSSGTMRI